MLALNMAQVQMQATPARSMLTTLACLLLGLTCVWIGLDHQGAIPWLGGLFFGGGGLALTYLGLKPARAYEPGVSFKAMRLEDFKIIRRYRLSITLGGIMAFATIVAYFSGWLEFGTTTELTLGAISLVGYGYYGLISKRVHGDVDAVALDLAKDYGYSSLSKIYLAYLNFTSSDNQNKVGNTILLIGADRLITCNYSNNSWQSTERPFSRIAALGFDYREDAFRLYFRFEDKSFFQIAIDPAKILTTEPLTFIRSFLYILDSWYENTNGAIAPSRHRAVIASNGCAEKIETIALVGQAQEAQFAAAAINGALMAFAPQPRKLEI